MGLIDNLKNMLGGAKADSSAPASYTPTLAPEPIKIVEVSPTALAAEIAQNQPVRVIDVRQSWDYSAMHIPGAVSIPLNSLPAHLGQLAPEDTLVLVCYHGISSQSGVAFLMERGYKNVRSMSGGFTQWAAEGRPTEK